jgi:hypothetical protein
MLDDESMVRLIAKRVEEVSPRWRLLGIFRVGHGGAYQVTARDVHDGGVVNVRLSHDPTAPGDQVGRDLVPVARDVAFYVLGALDAYKTSVFG